MSLNRIFIATISHDEISYNAWLILTATWLASGLDLTSFHHPQHNNIDLAEMQPNVIE
jgi:hypothetical protein